MNDYIKTVWQDLPDTSTPITADRLNNIEDGIEYLFEHGVGGGDTLPIGIILPFSDDTIPEGYMLCDGRAISRTTYAKLFNVIGTTYGAGDGSTTFNLPNLKGKVPVGYDSTDSDFDTLGETGGEKTHVLADNELPNTTNKYLSNASSGLDWGIQSGTSYAFKGVSLGSGEAHNNLQPYQVVNYIIKVLNAQNGEVRSESLPVGAEIDFDGTSQQIPTGWEEVQETVLKKEINANVLGSAGINWQNLGDLYLDLTPGTWFVKANTFITSNGIGIGYNKSCLSFNSTGGAVYDRLDSMISTFPNEQGASHSSVHSLSCIVSVNETTRIYLLEAFAYTGSNGSMTLMCDKDIASGGPSLIRATKLY